MSTLKENQNALYERWKKEKQYTYFVKDGILNYEKWNSIVPRIMFLLKETSDDFTCIADKSHDITKGNGTHFWWNICYWKYLVEKIFKGEDVVFIKKTELPEIKFNNNMVDSIAYVNIKKNCDNLSNSNDSEIFEYAISDKDLLKQQIEIIDPHVVFCSNITFNAYKYIFESQLEKINDICYQHKDRLIIKFYHPSYFQIPGGRKTLFVELHNALIANDSIFKLFKWGK